MNKPYRYFSGWMYSWYDKRYKRASWKRRLARAKHERRFSALLRAKPYDHHKTLAELDEWTAVNDKLFVKEWELRKKSMKWRMRKYSY